jgi:hypothetical protein
MPPAPPDEPVSPVPPVEPVAPVEPVPLPPSVPVAPPAPDVAPAEPAPLAIWGTGEFEDDPHAETAMIAITAAVDLIVLIYFALPMIYLLPKFLKTEIYRQ